MLYGMTAIAMGLFISSLTESIVIAAILSFAAMFVTYIMEGLISLITNTENSFTSILGKILGLLDFDRHVSDMFSGILNIRGIIYFLVMTLLFLFLTTQVIQKRRYTVSKSTLSVSAYSTGMIVVSIALTVIINLVADGLPDKYMSLDMTTQKMYSITDTTRDFLSDLDKDVQIYIIQDEKNKDDTIDKTVRQYADASKHITYEYKNPVTNPNFYKQYATDGMSINSLIVVCGDRYKVVDASDMYAQELDYSTYSYQVTGYDGEGQLTSALNYVTTENLPVGYYITGHGESKLDSNFTDAIAKQNIEFNELNLLTVDTIPEDAEFIVISGPQSDLSKDDASKIIDYAKGGGKLYVATYTTADAESTLPNFCSILHEFGVSIEPGVVAEQDRNHYYQSPYYLLPDVQYSTLTSNLINEKYIFAPSCLALNIDDTADGSDVDYLLKTSDSSLCYVEGMNDDDLKRGSFTLAASITKVFDNQKANLIIVSCSNMLSNDADMMVANANSTFFGNCIASFAPGDAGNISIPAKMYSSNSLIIDNGMGILYGITFAIILPIILIVAGFVIWFNRRKK